MKKECAKCHEKKELDTTNFPHNSKSKDNFDGRCKACWKLISAEKTRRKHSGETVEGRQRQTQDKVRATAKLKPWEGKLKPKAEIVPNDVQVVPLARYADLPGNGMQFILSEGSFLAAVEEYVVKFGVRPQIVYTPARFYLQIPDDKQDKIETVKTVADKPVKVRKSKVTKIPKAGKKKKEKQNVR